MDRSLIALTDPARSEFDAELAAFRNSFTAFLQRGADVGTAGAPARVLAAAGEHGFLATAIPEVYGGAGLDDPRFAFLPLREFAAAGEIGAALTYLGHSLVAAPALLRHGDDVMKQRWLPRMASGEAVAAIAGPAHPDGIGATSVEGGVVVDGSSEAIVSATEIRLFLVRARDSESGTELLVLVTPDTPGAELEPVALLGADNAPAARLRLTRAFIADDDVLARGDVADVHKDAQVALSALAVAGSRAVLDDTSAYVRERFAFGQPIAAFDNTQDVLGALLGELLVAETHVDACIAARSANALTPSHAAAAQLRCTALFASATDRCLQLHGGYGYMREYPISRAFAGAEFLRLIGGSGSIARRTLASELGLSPNRRSENRAAAQS